MTIALRYAAYSDVGCLREGNEDSGYAGQHLLAVADGLRARDAAADVLVLGTREGLESRLVPLRGYELLTIANGH